MENQDSPVESQNALDANQKNALEANQKTPADEAKLASATQSTGKSIGSLPMAVEDIQNKGSKLSEFETPSDIVLCGCLSPCLHDLRKTDKKAHNPRFVDMHGWQDYLQPDLAENTL